jgi:hypothetical protein
MTGNDVPGRPRISSCFANCQHKLIKFENYISTNKVLGALIN